MTPRPETESHAAQRRHLSALLEQHGLASRRDEILGVLRPAIGLATRDPLETDLAVGASRVGGEPDLPPDLAWPVGKDGPLLFVLQVRLAEVAPLDLEGLLPEEGLLSVFSDPFASEPRVMHLAPGPLARRSPPAGILRPSFRACGVDLRPELHLPPPGSAFIGRDDSLVALDSDEHSTYWDDVWLAWLEHLRPGPAGTPGIHQLLGYAVAERHEAQELDEEVLVGFDSDDRANMEWGDVHCVWVFITRDHLRARAFDALRTEL